MVLFNRIKNCTKSSFPLLVMGWSLLTFSCEKDTYVGPGIEGLYGNLEIIEPFSHDKPNGVNFANGDIVNFNAKFTIQASFNLKCKGLTSQAEYNIVGSSSDFAADGISWDGSAESTLFKSESVLFEVTFESSNDTLRDTVFINGTKDYSSLGYVVNDFESQDGFAAVTNELTQVSERQNFPLAAAEGQYYYTMTGDEPGSKYWMGAVRFVGLKEKVTNNNPEQVYFNAFFYGLDLPGTKSLVKFFEDEDGDGVADEVWRYDVFPLEERWIKQSFKLSECDIDGSATDGTLDPTKIIQIDMTLSTDGAASPNSPSHGYSVDFPIFTYGAPL